MIQQFQSISTVLGAPSAQRTAEAEVKALRPPWLLSMISLLTLRPAFPNPRYPLSKYLLQTEVGTELKITLKNNQT